jgi:serine/threonine-protein kinase
MSQSPDRSVSPPAGEEALQEATERTSPPTSPAPAPLPGERTEAYVGTAVPGMTEPDTVAPASEKGRGPGHKISTLGDYRLLRKLGTGGMGSVYLARQISLDRDVALKVMARELAEKPAFVERFYREARLMARLDHPHIVHCYGVGHDHGWHYLAMEYVDGGSLAHWLKRDRQLSVGDALHIILACAEALRHAHEQQLIHRDVKPDNVLISSKGIVKVGDLGLAKALDEDLAVTTTGTGAGTPLYMAPEQARDLKRVDHRCDLYALGCVLYRCLAGTTPFRGETMIEVLEVKEKGKFVPVRRRNSTVPERLDLIIDKLLAPRPEHRYQTCAELIKDLSGLGLASASLSFLGADAEPAAASLPTRPAAPAAKAPVQPKPKAQPRPILPLPDELSEDADLWYVTFTASDGRVVTQKLRTAQVIALIRSPHFDPHTQASKTLNGGYRNVGTYAEFAQVAHGKTAKEAADRKSSRFRILYEQIEEEQRKRHSRRWMRRVAELFSSWVAIAIVLSILSVGGFLIFLLIRFLSEWLGAKIDSMQ